LLQSIAEEHPHVLDDPNVQVIFEEFGDNALIFDVYFWVLSVGERGARQIRSDIRFSVNRAFAEHDLVIAFPKRDVHLDGTLHLETVNG